VRSRACATPRSRHGSAAGAPGRSGSVIVPPAGRVADTQLVSLVGQGPSALEGPTARQPRSSRLGWPVPGLKLLGMQERHTDSSDRCATLGCFFSGAGRGVQKSGVNRGWVRRTSLRRGSLTLR
jgi:hypothetical protein